jgi:hypothetical protein
MRQVDLDVAPFLGASGPEQPQECASGQSVDGAFALSVFRRIPDSAHESAFALEGLNAEWSRFRGGSMYAKEQESHCNSLWQIPVL